MEKRLCLAGLKNILTQGKTPSPTQRFSPASPYFSHMSIDGYRIRDQNAVHFVTFAAVQWADVFTRREYAEIVMESLVYCKEKKGLNIHAWCIMPSHVHLIISTKEPFRLSNVLRDFKKFTSVKILQAIEQHPKESRRGWLLWLFRVAGEENTRNNIYQFWQQDNHPIECSTAAIFNARMNYLHENPVKAGLVWKPEDYRYSSGLDYYSIGKGLIEIDRMD